MAPAGWSQLADRFLFTGEALRLSLRRLRRSRLLSLLLSLSLRLSRLSSSLSRLSLRLQNEK